MFEIIDNDYKLTQLQDAFRIHAQPVLRDIAEKTFNTHTYGFSLQRLKDTNGFKVKFMVKAWTFKSNIIEGETTITANYCLRLDGQKIKPFHLSQIQILQTLVIYFMKAIYSVVGFYEHD